VAREQGKTLKILGIVVWKWVSTAHI